MFSAEKACRLGGGRGCVLDRRRLVENHIVELDFRELVDVTTELAVRREDDVRSFQRPIVRPLAADVFGNGKIGRETAGLVLPIEDERARDDDEGSPVASFLDLS